MLKIIKENKITELWRLRCLCNLLLFVMSLWFLLGNGLAEPPVAYPSTPEEVVRKFCQLDAEGKRLSGDTMSDILGLVTWIETGAEVIFVISGFEVGKAIIADSMAKVPVEYHRLGSTDGIEFSEIPRKKITSYIYKLVKQNNMWKIQEPVSAPHVYWETAIAHLKGIQHREPARKEQLELIIQKIMKVKERVK